MPLYFLVILVIFGLTIPVNVYPALKDQRDSGNLIYSVHSLNNLSMHAAPDTTQVIITFIHTEERV